MGVGEATTTVIDTVAETVAALDSVRILADL